MGNIIKSRAWLLAITCGTAVILSASPVIAAPQGTTPESAVETQVQEAETAKTDETQETSETQETLETEEVESVPETSIEENTEEDSEEESDAAENEDEAQNQETEQDTLKDEDAAETGDEKPEESEEAESEQEDIYTAPENKSHVNISFRFTNASGIRPVYPVNLILKEVDTGAKEKLTIRSSGQIVELEHGDYQVISMKDSGVMPLVTSDQTMSIYENTSYTIQFQQNRGKKMFFDFLKDNALLIVVFIGAAAVYNATIIKNFNKHPRR